jgi:hypothetical protein
LICGLALTRADQVRCDPDAADAPDRQDFTDFE